VHCAYYSSFQYAKYILSEYAGVDYRQQKDACYSGDSHKVIWEMVCNELRKIDNASCNICSGHYMALRRMRIRADYDTCVTNEKEAKQSLRKAEALNQLLQNSYEHK
jgi:hypothetical protein